MQYLRNEWSDFKNSWGCLILTLLWIHWYTMYPPHLNYATTLPRKTFTMKITIFIIVLVLKSNETWKFDISDCHSLLTVQNPVKAVYLKTCSKCLPPAFTQTRSLLIKLNTALLMEFCAYCLQDFLQLVSGIWLVLKCLVAFKHSLQTW